MKKIEAIIRPEKLEVIRQGLVDRGISGMTALHALGLGQQLGYIEIYRGAEAKVQFLPKIKIELIVDEEYLQACVDCITEHGRTGRLGDGKIFISDIQQMISIRTGEYGVPEKLMGKPESSEP